MTERTKPLFAGKSVKPPRKPGRGPGRPTAEIIALRNEELLDKALDFFLENGFEATTIDAICNAVGMSRRTIYSRYGDKETLFRAALQRVIEQWVVPIETMRAQETADLEETLRAIARIWVGNVRKPSGMRLVRIANTEVFRRPEIAEYLWERTAQPTLGYLTDLFKRRLRPGAASTPDAEDAAAAFLILVVEGSIQLAVWGRMPDEEFERQIAYRTRLFLKGAPAALDSADPPSPE